MNSMYSMKDAHARNEANHARKESHPYYTLLLPYDDPRPSIYRYNPLNPYQDLESRGEFLQEKVEKHIELYHELINSGASYEAANKLIDLLYDFYLKDWRAREREWILVEEIRELIKTDPLHVTLRELEDELLGKVAR